MRILAGCVFAFATSAVHAPSSKELRQSPAASDSRGQHVDAETVRRLTPSAAGLRKRFGVGDSGNNVPDVFVLASNLMLTVRYGSDSLPCHLEIEPADLANPYLLSERVSELLDDSGPTNPG